jgi:mono/diheme cytochrome c family protein
MHGTATIRLIALACTGYLLAEAAPVSAAESVEPPKAMYLRYCGACHGPDGKGDGIAGTFMRPKPSDLTRIAARNDGEFSFTRVMRYIDGTQDVRAHGSPDMPVWGEIFRRQADWSLARHAEVQGTLMMITDYLRSIQEQ